MNKASVNQAEKDIGQKVEKLIELDQWEEARFEIVKQL